MCVVKAASAILIVTTLVLALSATCLLAQDKKADEQDFVRTTKGLVYRGKITEDKPDKVVILTHSGPITIPRQIIAEVRKAGVDYRSANEKIEAVEIPEGKEAAFLARATKLVGDGKHAEAAAICKGLRAISPSRLTARQRETVGQTLGQAFFNLQDWPAAASGLNYAARAVTNEMDRQRIRAMAQALKANKPPTIGGQTVDGFAQAMHAAMKWKADQIYDEAAKIVNDFRQVHQRDPLDRILQAADARLTQAEVFVPGYSIQRWPEVCRTMTTQMVGTVEKAAGKCTGERKELIRLYWQRTLTVKRAKSWNEAVDNYLKRRQAAGDCLANVTHIEQNHPLKMAYKDNEFKQFTEKRTNLAKTVEDLRYYDQDAKAPGRRNPITIRTKGKRIAPAIIGSR
jgi:hypothetical protein